MVAAVAVICALILVFFLLAVSYLSVTLVFASLRLRGKARGRVKAQNAIAQPVDNQNYTPPIRAPTEKKYFIDLNNLGTHEITEAEIKFMKKKGYKVIDETGAAV